MDFFDTRLLSFPDALWALQRQTEQNLEVLDSIRTDYSVLVPQFKTQV